MRVYTLTLEDNEDWDAGLHWEAATTPEDIMQLLKNMRYKPETVNAYGKDGITRPYSLDNLKTVISVSSNYGKTLAKFFIGCGEWGKVYIQEVMI